MTSAAVQRGAGAQQLIAGRVLQDEDEREAFLLIDFSISGSSCLHPHFSVVVVAVVVCLPIIMQ